MAAPAPPSPANPLPERVGWPLASNAQHRKTLSEPHCIGRASALPSLDLNAMRGLACILLVAFHVIGSDVSNGLRIGEGPWRVANDALAYLRMPLFTFLAGMVYAFHTTDTTSWLTLRHKARSLLVPMLFVGTLFAVAQSSMPATNWVDQGPGGRNWLMLHIEPVGHFWFVQALMWIFVLTWVLERMNGLATPRRIAFVGLLAVAVDLGLAGPPWLSIDGAIYLWPHFLTGLAVARFSWWEKVYQRRSQWALLGVALVAMAQLGMPQPNPDRHSVWILLAGMALCGLCLSLRLKSRWLARIGASAYAIYLFHVFFTAGSRMALNTLGLNEVLLQVVLGTALGVGAPLLVERWAHRGPWRRLLLLGKSPQGHAATPP